MNIVFDPSEWSPLRHDDAGPQGCTHPDWYALRARLKVGIEAWALLGSGRSALSGKMFGSFSRRAAMSLERIAGHCDPVNQTSSVNRKRSGCIILDVAGMSSIGERG